jgi:Ca-activated chloride channel homolog
MMGFRLQDPLWLLLLIPLVGMALWQVYRQRRAAVLYSNVAILKSLPVTLAMRIKRLLPWLFLGGLCLLVIALARPQRGREEFRIRSEGIAIQMCIDRSGSMQALDFEIDQQRANRLAVVKKTFREFVAGGGGLSGRDDDLIGLIAFGGYADALCPLTLDHGALLHVLDAVEIPQPIRDAQGHAINERLLQEELSTAIGDALALAVDRLKPVDAKSKIIILLSDGESNAGVIQPAEAAEAAKAFGMKIYAIGVGTTGTVPMPATDPFGRQVLVPSMVQIDEAALKALADTTGGRYFNVQDTETLRNVYAEIDRLEKSISEGRIYTEYRELYQYAMFPGLGLILLQIALVSTRFRSLP